MVLPRPDGLNEIATGARRAACEGQVESQKEGIAAAEG